MPTKTISSILLELQNAITGKQAFKNYLVIFQRLKQFL